MLLQASTVIWGSALATLFTLLAGLWTVRWIRRRGSVAQEAVVDQGTPPSVPQPNEMPTQDLTEMMKQQTDSMLAALARTIDQERQKLGMIVRNPSIDAAIEPAPVPEAPVSDTNRGPYERVVPMAGDGVDIQTIARRLNMSESEVSMVLRLKAA
jgi:hypothetical protein